MPKDVYPGLAWINGERPGDQHNVGAVQSCGREPWTLLSGWLRACCAILPHAETLESNLSRRLVSVSDHIPCSPDFLQGGIRKPLLHFGTEYHLLSAVFALFKAGTPPPAPFMIFVSCWLSGWDAQLASALLGTETTRSLGLNK